MPRCAFLFALCAYALLASCAAKPKLMALNIDSGRADWIKSTYITGDTEEISAKLDRRAIDARLNSMLEMGSRHMDASAVRD